MVDAVDDVLLSHTQYGLPDQCLVAILDQPGQLASPQCPERLLHLRKHEFNGIIVWAVWHVVYDVDALLRQYLLDRFRLMYW